MHGCLRAPGNDEQDSRNIITRTVTAPTCREGPGQVYMAMMSKIQEILYHYHVNSLLPCKLVKVYHYMVMIMMSKIQEIYYNIS